MTKTKKKLYLQQKKRSLKKIVGTEERPRLAIYRSHKHIYAQVIDDKTQRTLAFSSTLDVEVRQKIQQFATQEASFLVGESIAKKATSKNIERIVFDRGNKPYHGRIQKLAEGARQAGLVF
jgi:large subunit ribosomal protein L18